MGPPDSNGVGLVLRPMPATDDAGPSSSDEEEDENQQEGDDPGDGDDPGVSGEEEEGEEDDDDEEDSSSEEEDSESVDEGTQDETDAKIQRFFRAESELDEIYEQLEDESLAKTTDAVRLELSETKSGLELDAAVDEEMCTYKERKTDKASDLQDEISILQDELEDAGVSLPELYKLKELQAPEQCQTEAWRNTQWVGVPAPLEAIKRVHEAEQQLKSQRPVKHHRGKVLEEGASGYLAKRMKETRGSEDSVASEVDWSMLGKDETPSNGCLMGTDKWAPVYTASTPEDVARLGLQLPGQDKIEEIGDMEEDIDPLFVVARQSERDRGLNPAVNYRKVAEEDDVKKTRSNRVTNRRIGGPRMPRKVTPRNSTRGRIRMACNGGPHAGPSSGLGQNKHVLDTIDEDKCSNNKMVVNEGALGDKVVFEESSIVTRLPTPTRKRPRLLIDINGVAHEDDVKIQDQIGGFEGAGTLASSYGTKDFSLDHPVAGRRKRTRLVIDSDDEVTEVEEEVFDRDGTQLSRAPAACQALKEEDVVVVPDMSMIKGTDDTPDSLSAEAGSKIPVDQLESVCAVAGDQQLQAISAVAGYQQLESVGAVAGDQQLECIGAVAGDQQLQSIGAVGGHQQLEAICPAGGDQLESICAAESDQLKSIGAIGGDQLESMGAVGGERLETMCAVGVEQLESVGAVGGDQLESIGAVGGGHLESIGAVGVNQLESMGAVGGEQLESMGAVGGDHLESLGAVGGDQLQCIGAVSGSGSEQSGKFTCTGCGTLIEHIEVQRHPMLPVGVCTGCLERYHSGPFTKGEDGSESECRWCGDGGSIVCCEHCDKVFCETCIQRNLGEDELRRILETETNWECFLCNQKPLKMMTQTMEDILRATTLSKNTSGRKRRRNIKSISDYAERTKELYALERERQERQERWLENEARGAAAKKIALLDPESEPGVDKGKAVCVAEDVVGLAINRARPAEEQVVRIWPDISKHLRPHQLNGVRFMWENCIESIKHVTDGAAGQGCILAHSMGLGKTLQVIAFLHTVLRLDWSLRTALIVVPLNVLHNWKNEFLKWQPEECPVSVHMIDEPVRDAVRFKLLRTWHEKGGVLLIGYTSFRTLVVGKSREQALKDEYSKYLQNPGPDILVCDEAHTIKNEKAEITKALKRVATRRRIALTGSPMQNNLMEYYCMVDFVREEFLESPQAFRNRFLNPIENGQLFDSTSFDVRLMRHRASVLHTRLKGFVQRVDMSVLKSELPPKCAFIISVRLAPVQRQLYRTYLNTHGFRGAILAAAASQNVGSMFHAFHTLSKVWNHPDLLWSSKEAKRKESKERKVVLDEVEESDPDNPGEDKPASGDDKPASGEDKPASGEDKPASGEDKPASGEDKPASGEDKAPSGEDKAPSGEDKPASDEATAVPGESARRPIDYLREADESLWWKELYPGQTGGAVEYSGKVAIILDLLRMFSARGDKALVFSQSLGTLDLIESHLERLSRESGGNWRKGIEWYRFDGHTPGVMRQDFVDRFNDSSNVDVRCMLISTRAGSLGINLPAANRVIIVDGSWNPTHDLQALFRAWRFGQTKPVFAYRLIACKTMEERIYKRQVFKESVAARVLDKIEVGRLFHGHDLLELFKLDDEDDGYNEKTMTLRSNTSDDTFGSSVPPAFCPSLVAPNPVKDDVMQSLFVEHYPRWIVRYLEHDPLLMDMVDQKLSAAEEAIAWEEYQLESESISAQELLEAQALAAQVAAAAQVHMQQVECLARRRAQQQQAQQQQEANPAVSAQYQHQQQHQPQLHQHHQEQELLQQKHQNQEQQQQEQQQHVRFDAPVAVTVPVAPPRTCQSARPSQKLQAQQLQQVVLSPMAQLQASVRAKMQASPRGTSYVRPQQQYQGLQYQAQQQYQHFTPQQLTPHPQHLNSPHISPQQVQQMQQQQVGLVSSSWMAQLQASQQAQVMRQQQQQQQQFQQQLQQQLHQQQQQHQQHQQPQHLQRQQQQQASCSTPSWMTPLQAPLYEQVQGHTSSPRTLQLLAPSSLASSSYGREVERAAADVEAARHEFPAMARVQQWVQELTASTQQQSQLPQAHRQQEQLLVLQSQNAQVQRLLQTQQQQEAAPARLSWRMEATSSRGEGSSNLNGRPPRQYPMCSEMEHRRFFQHIGLKVGDKVMCDTCKQRVGWEAVNVVVLD